MPRFKRIVKEGSFDACVQIARRQVEDGADAIESACVHLKVGVLRPEVGVAPELSVPTPLGISNASRSFRDPETGATTPSSNACLLNGFQKLERLQQASSSHDVLRRLGHNAEVPQLVFKKGTRRSCSRTLQKQQQHFFHPCSFPSALLNLRNPRMAGRS